MRQTWQDPRLAFGELRLPGNEKPITSLTVSEEDPKIYAKSRGKTKSRCLPFMWAHLPRIQAICANFLQKSSAGR